MALKVRCLRLDMSTLEQTIDTEEPAMDSSMLVETIPHCRLIKKVPPPDLGEGTLVALF